jgi:hypothetical protein
MIGQVVDGWLVSTLPLLHGAMLDLLGDWKDVDAAWARMRSEGRLVECPLGNGEALYAFATDEPIALWEEASRLQRDPCAKRAALERVVTLGALQALNEERLGPCED